MSADPLLDALIDAMISVGRCYSCGQEHPAAFDADHEPWRICYECFHVFTTAEDAEAFDRAKWGQARPAAEMYSCPCCVHDW